MDIDITRYRGREQAYVKHYFLGSYLQDLIHKVAGSYDHIVYVDGFSGPWQSGDENFGDTSFAIALNALRSAKATWRNLGRNVKMTAHLVEMSKIAFRKLESIPAKFPDIEVLPRQGNFVELAEALAREIPKSAFVFLFIDPKGWSVNLEEIKGLLTLPNCEVVFNFMFDFINRAASMKDPAIVKSIDDFITVEHWRNKLIAAIDEEKPDREAILVDAFKTSLADAGGYKYVAATPILRPLRDRTLYYLIYATRKPHGIEVFRSCQIETLRTQSAIRGATKLAASTLVSGQSEAFNFNQMTNDQTEEFLKTEKESARNELYHMTPFAPDGILYGDIWPLILSKHAIRKTDLNILAAEARRSGTITVKNWEPRHRVPSNHYFLQRVNSLIQ
ncbi:three-Cys-motif partner protein TcmP [Acidocella sp.]|uniref:three-Cys-motif partner protein TcmP n=1 Tax=Acidocella sp. TaxID=50710 RepID=UPI0017BD20D6|nr:three-Cys-motif partner protein TcmP [Acidocella sp.]NNM55967.1 three-Cys-motif partner protein TcmP [Acidocella sp.]